MIMSAVKYNTLNVFNIFTVINSFQLIIVYIFYILFFLYYLGKYRAYFSETLAPLHPIIKLFFIFNKLSRVQVWVQVGCRWVQVGCRPYLLIRTCTQLNYLKYITNLIKGARVQSYRSALTILFPVFPFDNKQKNRLYIINIYYWWSYILFNLYKQLWNPCQASRLADCFHGQVNGRKKRNNLIAHSYRNCDTGLLQSNRFNHLDGLTHKKTAIRKKISYFLQGLRLFDRLSPLKSNRGLIQPAPPLLPIICTTFVKLFNHSMHTLFFFSFKSSHFQKKRADSYPSARGCDMTEEQKDNIIALSKVSFGKNFNAIRFARNMNQIMDSRPSYELTKRQEAYLDKLCYHYRRQIHA